MQEVPPLLNGDSSSSRSQQQQRSSQSDSLSPSSASQQNGHAHSSSTASPAHSQPAVGVVSSVGHTSGSSHSSLQGLTPPLTAPHSPPLPHSAPLSRALTPVPSAAPHAVSGLGLLYGTSTLPLPRRQSSDAHTSFLGLYVYVFLNE